MTKSSGSDIPSIYDFDPGRLPDQGERYITLEANGSEESVISSTQEVEPAVSQILNQANQGCDWGSLASEILTADYLARLIAALRDNSALPELVTTLLFQHLVKVYRYKVETTLQSDGIDAIDTTLPHFKLNRSRKQQTKKLELAFDDERIKAYLKNSLSEFFNHVGFWEEFAKAIGANLVVWAIEHLEEKLSSKTLNAFSQNQLIEEISQLLTALDSKVLQEKIGFFGQVYSQDIAKKIVQEFNLPNCSLQEMDKLLGLRQRPPFSSSRSLEFDPITVIPTSIPIASSIRAQLRPDLWQQSSDDLAVFQYRSRSNPNNYIEHFITNPGDIEMMPWEAAEQIINKFGFDTVKLQLIFAARTMQEDEPWNSTFTLKATDIVQLLGWDRNHNTTLAEKRNAVASTAYALSCMLVKSVWVEGRGKKKVDASTPIGRMWDVLLDIHGQMDWMSSKIEKPEEVYITVSPGLWTKHFLNRAGSRAKEALHQFGYLAQDILRIDPYHNEMALRLAIQLTLDSRIRVRNQNPYDYQVVGLLEEVLPQPEIEKALQDKHKARDLKNRWNKALELLLSLGWQIEFDPKTYPDWLQPGSTAPKPNDWRKVRVIDRLLQAKLTIKPPHPIPHLLAGIKDAKKPKAIIPTPAQELTGEEIRKAREEQKWSRKELGGFLDLSADYVGKLERGDRVVTPELEARLRKLLRL
ncbi:helix-turn-helix domain-containing protein [Leptolyngbya sp. NIES-2104]|uniref:helix-turn-helix domain-containing protein n=1 Tax=Leptolyngbya sp. NIES-2104 TaxID=1552121 RepID=UPI0006EC5288|nr:helix-turn-helix transcriptional regulator [Leptolyngbya sp. NIES-2104]GAP99549.1 ferredoxin [Leptolyngbya sp. NIES-2104]